MSVFPAECIYLFQSRAAAGVLIDWNVRVDECEGDKNGPANYRPTSALGVSSGAVSQMGLGEVVETIKEGKNSWTRCQIVTKK